MQNHDKSDGDFCAIARKKILKQSIRERKRERERENGIEKSNLETHTFKQSSALAHTRHEM